MNIVVTIKNLLLMDKLQNNNRYPIEIHYYQIKNNKLLIFMEILRNLLLI